MEVDRKYALMTSFSHLFVTTKMRWQRYLFLLWQQRNVDDVICSCCEIWTAMNLLTNYNERWFVIFLRNFSWDEGQETIHLQTLMKFFVNNRTESNVFSHLKTSFSYRGRERVSNYVKKLTVGRVLLTSIYWKSIAFYLSVM